ncbi:hypothetical protein [Spirulina subsalsa]|uniref:hypothetical protein n=1 Tax=Spirulina subsalsa TaxID=54311 RepID=UPI0002E110D7|nr:hypothetical protein [Spirulina subsalsa]
MAYWVRIQYERQEYIVDLDHISAFVCAPNGRLTFWLPESASPIVINHQASPDDYYRVLNYITQLANHSLSGSWIRLLYDRSEYIIDLNRISTFCYSPNQKITFWLPDASIPIIITQLGDPEGYEKVRDFIYKKTGEVLS